MRAYRYYKHKDNTTVAIEVLKSFYVKERSRWNVKVAWWKWSPTRGLEWPMEITQRFNITNEQRTNWKVLP